MSIPQRQYLDIAVPRRLFRVFTYATPDILAGPWLPGMRVRVPFGRELLTGYILRVASHLDAASTQGKQIKEIIARLDDVPIINAELLALTQWVAEHYLAAPGQCLRLAFPGNAETRKRRLVRNREAQLPIAPVPIAATPLSPEFLPFRNQLMEAIRQHRPETILIAACTEKLAEAYRDAVQTVCHLNRTALVLVPETQRIEPLRRFLASRPDTQSEAYHGELSVTQHRKAWARIQQGEARLVVGTRSAVFAPLRDLGLIIVDQEENSSYKAENAPRYDTRVVAAERARQTGAVLVLASAHPSLESVHATGSTATATLVRDVAGLPPVRVINLREAAGEILSAPLANAIAERLADRSKVLLFLNRKGYASVLLCRDCGQAIRCPSCAVGWSFHKQERILSCAHCGRRESAPTACPSCQGIRLFPSGLGTEALEEAVRLRFPQARVARLERASGRSKNTDRLLLARFRSGDLDILIGTQLVLTATPPLVASLVGIVRPDVALHLPDFLGAERAYHTLRDVTALAHPNGSDALVMIQTYMPEHHVIRALADGNPTVFYDSELAARAALGYPPFGRLIGLRVTGTQEDRVAAAAERWATLLRAELKRAQAQESGRMELLGPIQAVPARLRGRFRRQLILKGADERVLRESVRRTLAKMESESRAGNLRYDVDVDPQSFLG